MYTQEQRNDHAHDLRKHEASPRHQKRAVVELVGYLHGLMQGGHFAGTPEIERMLHTRICRVCSEFDMDKPPAPSAPAPATYEPAWP